MALLKALLVLGIAFGAFTLYAKYRQAHPAPAAAGAPDANVSPAGFVLLNREEARNPTVTVMVAPGCPRDEAVRGRELHAALQQAGIPCTMSNTLQISFTDPAEAQRVQQFMSRVQNPLVLVRGWAKGNPSLEDVVAQYRAR
jgi:hypothetical protein